MRRIGLLAAVALAAIALGSVTPNLSDEAIELWQQRRDSDPATQAFRGQGLILETGRGD